MHIMNELAQVETGIGWSVGRGNRDGVEGEDSGRDRMEGHFRNDMETWYSKLPKLYEGNHNEVS